MTTTVDEIALTREQEGTLRAMCTVFTVLSKEALKGEDPITKDELDVFMDPGTLCAFVADKFTFHEYTTVAAAFVWCMLKIDEAETNIKDKMLSREFWERTDDGKRYTQNIHHAQTQFAQLFATTLVHVRKIPSKLARNKLREAHQHLHKVRQA